jgi:hypothetical protein
MGACSSEDGISLGESVEPLERLVAHLLVEGARAGTPGLDPRQPGRAWRPSGSGNVAEIPQVRLISAPSFCAHCLELAGVADPF